MALIRYPVLKYAYVVDDLEAACRGWVDLVGAGPFFVSMHHWSPDYVYRGEPCEADLSYAFVQAGPAHIQLIMQHNDAPSVLGCFVEIYEDNAPLRETFAQWKATHERWDGIADPIRSA